MTVHARARRRIGGILTAALAMSGLAALTAAPAYAADRDGVYNGENSHGYGITITVEDDTVTKVETTSTTVCLGGGFAIPFPTAFTETPEIPIRADGTFEAQWVAEIDEYTEAHYWFGGEFIGDTIVDFGSNAADVVDGAMLCSGTQFSYSAERESAPEPVYDPEVTVTPQELTVDEMGADGVWIEAGGFPAEAELWVSVGTKDTLRVDADANGEWEGAFRSTAFTPGVHDVVATYNAGGLRAETTFTVLPNPAVVYEPEITVSPESVTVSELADEGVEVSATGLPEDADAELLLDGVVIDEVSTDADGEVTAVVTAQAEPGVHDLVVRSGQWEAAAELTVTADPVVYDPSVSVDPSTATVSQLAEQGILVSGSGFPAEADIEVLFDGAAVDDAVTAALGARAALPTQPDGSFSFRLALTDVAPGDHSVLVRAGGEEAEAAVIVEPDPAPAPEIELTLSAETISESALAEEGVLLTGTGLAEGDAAEVLVDEVRIAELTADAAGMVEHRIIGADLTPGAHTVTLVVGDASASATLVVTEDPAVPGPGDDDDEPGPGDDDEPGPGDDDEPGPGDDEPGPGGDEPGPGDGGDALPATGADGAGITLLAGLGALLLLGGGAVLGIRRRTA